MPAPRVDLPERMNAAELLVDANVTAGRGAKAAVLDAATGAAFTYEDVLRLSCRFGNALRELGTRMEERVMLVLPDSVEFVAAFFGAIRIGAVPIPTNTLLKPHEYEYLLNDSRARVLVIEESLLPPLEPVLRNLRGLRHVVVVGNAGRGRVAWRDLTRAASPELSPELMSRDDACFWLYSSGTTGFPKGAVHLQHDMFVAADLYALPTLGLTPADRTYSLAKLFFAYGLGNGLYFAFRAGATTILNPAKPDPVRSFEIIQQYRPTVFYGVPTGYARMLDVPDARTRFDTGSLRLCVSAGEALPATLFETWKSRFGTEILDGIGSTEILHIFISNRAGSVTPGSTGEIVPGYEARIVDEQGHDMPDGGVGDLLIRGDSTCAYYWNQHEKTRETILGSWIRTGDKYLRDPQGRFWYQGRSDDMLKVGGLWVSPVEVENALIAHPAVLESAVVGAADPAGLVKVKAYVLLKSGREGSEVLVSDLQAFVKERIGAFKAPRWVEFVTELPKTATGKTQRYKLR
ncbi:MAG: benzoate-CoA ligase family protein [Planctomycetes bacterium]|nr:benzoate-CoA ligase family protein [Planctomycetota bacterium]